MIGIPWGETDPETGDITCPVCGLQIGEAYDDDGERETNRYGEHFEFEHAGPLTTDDRQSIRAAIAAMQQQGLAPVAIIDRLRWSQIVKPTERDAVEAFVRYVLAE